MKKLSTSFYFKVGLIGVVLLSLYTGLADSDWYWQVKLGESIIKYSRFNDFSSIVWVKDLGYYLDHEWLSNVIFYLLSLLPYGMIITKVLLVSLCCFSTYMFIFNHKRSDNTLVVISTLFLLFICSITVFKVKPYMFSYIFLLLELYFLDNINTLKGKIGLALISILWINMHGSYPLFIGVFGLYILFNIKSGFKDNVLTFIASFLGSFINPFGYKLVLFNLLHNNNSIMKVLIQDWKCVDCKTSLGVVVFLVIIFYILLLSLSKVKFDFGLVLSIITLFMTLGSARHLLYFVVSIIYLLNTLSINIKPSKKFVFICSYLSVVIGTASSISLFSTGNFRKDYMFNFVDYSTVNNIKSVYKDIDYKGLFLNSGFNSVLGDDIKTFTCGIYPLVENEVKDEIYMTWYSSTKDIEKIIKHYDLTGFVVDKYSNYEGYTSESVLYQYLSNSSDYICLNDTENYGFFVKKSLVNK